MRDNNGMNVQLGIMRWHPPANFQHAMNAWDLRIVGDYASPTKYKAVTSANVPAEFICPITLEMMNNPVVASDGHSYEADSLRDLFDSARRSGTTPRSPTTRDALMPYAVPNHNLRSAIQEWAEKNPDLVKKQ
jgi:hypothetical protein